MRIWRSTLGSRILLLICRIIFVQEKGKEKGKGKVERCEPMEVDEFSYGAWKRRAEKRADCDREGMFEATKERL